MPDCPYGSQAVPVISCYPSRNLVILPVRLCACDDYQSDFCSFDIFDCHEIAWQPGRHADLGWSLSGWLDRPTPNQQQGDFAPTSSLSAQESILPEKENGGERNQTEGNTGERTQANQDESAVKQIKTSLQSLHPSPSTASLFRRVHRPNRYVCPPLAFCLDTFCHVRV